MRNTSARLKKTRDRVSFLLFLLLDALKDNVKSLVRRKSKVENDDCYIGI